MKQKILILGLAAVAWGTLYAFGMVELWSLSVIGFGAAVNFQGYYDGTQIEMHRGGIMRVQQVGNDGGAWGSTASDFMANDSLSIYELGYLDDLEIIKTESATPIIDINGTTIGHSLSQGQIAVRGTSVGTIAKYAATSASNAVYYADQLFGSGMDRVLFKAACYFPNDVPNQAGTNGSQLKIVFWTGRFIITRYGLRGDKSNPRTVEWMFLPSVLQSKSGSYRNGGQVYQRRAVASVQAIASEDFETQAEVTVA